MIHSTSGRKISPPDNLAEQIVKLYETKSKTKCEEPDSNRRTPAGMDPKSIAFDLSSAILARYTNQRIECLNLVPDPKSGAFDLA